MTADEIIQRQLAVPFVPYTLYLADRREMEIEHPEVVSLEPESATLVLSHRTGYAEVIDLSLIVSLKYRIDDPQSYEAHSIQ